jgi:methylated-DNA-[protein]-cysteine S-methyltransferase
MKNSIIFSSPFGLVKIAEEDNKITELYFVKEVNMESRHTSPLLIKARKQFLEYITGIRKTFDLPIAPQGTVFQKAVWQALRSIPYGETRSYKQIAVLIGKPTASRAVGMANNKNPILIVTPCHRVIGSNGQLVGFAAGLEVKKKLLELEKAL